MIRFFNPNPEWKCVALEELFDVTGGVPAPQNDAAFSDNGTPFVRMKDLGRYHLTNNLCETDSKLNEDFKDFKITPKGSILMPRSGSVALNHRAILGMDAVVVSHICALVPKRTDFDINFLYYLLCRMDMRKLTKKTTGLDSIAFSDLRKIEIPLPPLAEQQRIAARLDAADRLRALRRDALARLDALTHALFLEMFGDPAHNPMNWPVVNFEDVVFFQEGPGVRNWQFRDEGIKLINVRNIVNGVLTLENTDRHLDPAEVEKKYQHFLLDAGDYVLASSGVTWGKIAEVLPKHLPLCLNTSIIRLRPKDESIDRTYLKSFVLSSSFTRQIERLITGSAQPNFGPSHLKQVLINLPPLSLQLRFAGRLEQIERVRARMEESRLELDALFASLQSAAFEAG